jgi:DME family drug/metabolite transporter
MTGVSAQENKAGRPTQHDTLGSLAVLIATALWGTSGIFIKLIAAEMEISALALAFWRDITTFLLLVVGLGVLRPAWLRVRRRDLPWMVALGGSLGVFHVIWNLGVFLNGAAVATVQQAAMPAIVAVAAWLIWREPLTWRKMAAIVLTFAGTVLISGSDVLGQGELSAGGLLVGLGIPILYASWNLLGKKVRQDHNPFTTLTYAFAFAVLVLSPMQFVTPQPWPVPDSAVLWFGGLIVVSTIVPFLIYTFALGRLPASVATILAMSEIAFVAVYASTLLGERLTASQILGAVLVVGGVALLSWQGWRRNRVLGQDSPRPQTAPRPADSPPGSR